MKGVLPVTTVSLLALTFAAQPANSFPWKNRRARNVRQQSRGMLRSYDFRAKVTQTLDTYRRARKLHRGSRFDGGYRRGSLSSWSGAHVTKLSRPWSWRPLKDLAAVNDRLASGKKVRVTRYNVSVDPFSEAQLSTRELRRGERLRLHRAGSALVGTPADLVRQLQANMVRLPMEQQVNSGALSTRRSGAR